jgi:hypothetical protein
MGKAAKAHRVKVEKRNRKMQQEKNFISKQWNEAMTEQMEKLREKFSKMSAETENNVVEETVLNEVSEDTAEPVGSVQGE